MASTRHGLQVCQLRRNGKGCRRNADAGSLDPLDASGSNALCGCRGQGSLVNPVADVSRGLRDPRVRAHFDKIGDQGGGELGYVTVARCERGSLIGDWSCSGTFQVD